MTLTWLDKLMETIEDDPGSVREAFRTERLTSALEGIGIKDVRLVELHAPSQTARKTTGFGTVLCTSKKGVRHALVTCDLCKKKLR